MELLKKLNLKDQPHMLVLHAPEEFGPVLKDWEKILHVERIPGKDQSPFLLLFVRDKAQLEESRTVLKSSMDPQGLIWVAYPKKSSKRYKSDLSRDDFWEAFKDMGLEPVRQIALTEDWSVIRFRPGNLIKRKG